MHFHFLNSFLLRRKAPVVASVFCAAFLICIASCNNKKGEEANEESPAMDSTQTAANIVTEDSTMIFNNPGDLNNQTATSVRSNWNRFKLKDFWYEDSLQQKPYEANAEFYNDYDSLLKWSKDSSYILDIGSYSMMSVKDRHGKKHLESGEADSEIALLDPKTKMRTRLLFFGPGATIAGAQWIDSNQVAILGVLDEDADNKPDTTLWIIKPKDKFFKKYELK
ncbi:MAG: hypothetical protein ACTHJ5_18290 [Ilyomonas sp.]